MNARGVLRLGGRAVVVVATTRACAADTSARLPTAEKPGAHVRRAHPGDHREKLHPETIGALNRDLAGILERFDYTP